MLIRAGYDINFMANSPTPMIAMLNLHPSRAQDLRTPHRIVANRPVPMEDFTDSFGNVCTRLTVPAGGVSLSCDFVIEDSGEPDRQSPYARQHSPVELPADVLVYLLGSRYCETDRLSDIAWNLFGSTAPGWARVQAIVDYAHRRMTYGYQHARSTRTAWEGHQEQVGVCRDFAHLAIALCRCMNIPARYCSGYLGDIGIAPVDVAMDFHAWFEVYLGGAWHSFDARHNVPRIGRILMATGRDAADTPLTTAFGSVWLGGFKVVTDEVADHANAGEMLRLAA
ncbi:transglutaminase-like domain-containing protein [Novosphingobium lentum]|uniref:transglutaminase-like domain-containing protein n=1 Tax=Novosphingobium lentum TaxID=145287 RepID=UPI00082BC993|nr:transglutaminase family protein [Novosphingobium lentum]